MSSISFTPGRSINVKRERFRYIEVVHRVMFEMKLGEALLEGIPFWIVSRDEFYLRPTRDSLVRYLFIGVEFNPPNQGVLFTE